MNATFERGNRRCFELRLPLGMLLLVALLALLAPPAEADAACPEKAMYIVAHQDDDLLFQSPDLLEDIQSGNCVRTVFLTAGDAGEGTAYWEGREQGSRAAYAEMAGVPGSGWIASEPKVLGHTLQMQTLQEQPEVSEVYLRLPDGGPWGWGYPATGDQSLPRLWLSEHPGEPGLGVLTPIPQITAIDGSGNSYSYADLIATLAALMEEFQPDVVAVQNFEDAFAPWNWEKIEGDHYDHTASAKFAVAAEASYRAEHVLKGYLDYQTLAHPPNVPEPQLALKSLAYYTYGGHDSHACSTAMECHSPPFTDYGNWFERQIVRSERSVPGAAADPNQSVASKATVTLDGSGSSDPLGNPLTYEWKQTSGPPVELSDPAAVKPTFKAPIGPTSLEFELVVDNGEAESLPASVTVTVAAPVLYQLSVSKPGNGGGTVTSSPAGIDCGTACKAEYETDTTVTLSPDPDAGSEFTGWSGACSGTGTCQVTMSEARSVGAEFTLQRHQLSVGKSGNGGGTVTSSPAGIDCGATCSASFDHGTVVTLSASPGADSEAAVWSGCDEVTAAGACLVSIDAPREAIARFDRRILPPQPEPRGPQPSPAPLPAPTPPAPKADLIKSRIKHQRGLATFVFRGRGNAAAFECALAKVRRKPKYKTCTSPITYRRLRPSKYTFRVRAVAPNGRPGKPVTRKFKIRGFGRRGPTAF